MSSNFHQELIQRYQYVSEDGRYRVTQWVDTARIIHQEKVGYATEADAIAEADALARLVDDHNLSGTLYACVDISDLDGVDRAARELYVSRFQDGDYNWVVALFGANALMRFIGRIFQRRDLALQFRHCKTRRDAMFFLHGQIIRRDDSRVALHPGSFGLDVESGSGSGSENANRFAYRSPTGDLFVVYKQIAPDIVFISLTGTLEKREELLGAQRVAEQMYQQIAAARFYVILDSSGLKRVSLSARRAYLEYVKNPGSRERLVVHIGSHISRLLLRSFRLVTSSTFGSWRSARNMADALKVIELDRDSLPGEAMNSPVVDHASYGPAEDLSGLSVKPIVDWLIHLGWDVNFEPASLMVAPGHPYHELVMSIQLLQNDLRESFALQNEQLQALKENREKLEKARLVLEEGHVELKAYLAAISHDVRTPLTSLKLGLSRITDEQLPKNLGPTLRAEVQHLDSLFANMLSLARLKVIGADVLAPMPCDLAILLDRVRTRLLFLAQDRNVEIDIQPADFDSILLADELAIEQALTNVIHNAIKFARSRTSLWIEMTQASFIICIQDDGPGVEVAHDVRTIEANLVGPMAELTEGLGLGIAIAKRIMTNHGGALFVTKAHDPGTLVKMHLPKEQNDSVSASI